MYSRFFSPFRALIFFSLVWAFLLLPRVACADKVLRMDDPLLAARVRMDLAANAKKEIVISTFMFFEDAVGMEFIREIREARLKKVPVTLILDSPNNKISKPMQAYMQSLGVNIYEFGQFQFPDFYGFTKRMHDKIFLVDGEHLVMGDRNITNGNYSLGSYHSIGRDIYVEGGNSAAEASKYVKELIQSKYVTKVEPIQVSDSALAAAKAKVDSQEKKLQGFRRLTEAHSNWREKIKKVKAVTFFHDPIDKGMSPGVETELLKAIENAHDRIVIENPYIVLTPEFREALQKAADNHVPITVYTNSRYSNDWKLMGAAWEESRDILTKMGASIWEHRGPTVAKPKILSKKTLRYYRASSMLHAKSLVVDDKSYVISYNLDRRSQSLNRELLGRIDDPELADDLVVVLTNDQYQYIHTVEKGNVITTIPPCSAWFRGVAKILEPQI